MISGEGSEPVFSCDAIPFDDNFGLPIIDVCFLKRIHYLAKSPHTPLTDSHIMILDVDVWNLEGEKISTNSVVFTNNVTVHTFSDPIVLPAHSNVVVKYRTKIGTFDEYSRFRLALHVS